MATTADLTQRADITQPVTKGEAYQALAAHLRRQPGRRAASCRSSRSTSRRHERRSRRLHLPAVAAAGHLDADQRDRRHAGAGLGDVTRQRKIDGRQPSRRRSVCDWACSGRPTSRRSTPARSCDSGRAPTCSRSSPTSFRCSSCFPADIAWRYTPAKRRRRKTGCARGSGSSCCATMRSTRWTSRRPIVRTRS